MTASAPRVRGARTVAALTVALVMLLVPFLPVGAAWAHAQLLSSDPVDGAVLQSAPEQVELVFDEPVQAVEEGMQLLTADGEPRVLPVRTEGALVTVALPADLADASYAVSYRVVSADGHPVTGAVSFQVGAGGANQVQVPESDTAAATVAVAVLTGVHLLGGLPFAGLLLFQRCVRRGSGAPDRWTRRVLAGTGGVAVLGSALLVIATAARLTGGGADAWFGALPPDRLAVAVLTLGGCLGGLWAATRRPRCRAVQLIAAGVVALAPVLTGHSRSTPPLGVTMVADGVHLLAAAFWVGGVVALVHVLLAEKNRSGTDRTLRTGPGAVVLVERFSALAIAVVAALVLAGVVLALLVLDAPGDLLATGYGRTLALKLSLVLVVLTVAAWNRQYLRRLVPDHTAAGAAVLRRVLRYEGALLATVVLLTGVLTTMSPGHQHSSDTAPTTQAVSGQSQGLRLTGTVQPAHVGRNTFTFQLWFDESAVADQVRVRYRLPEADLGPLEAAPELDPATGAWTVELWCTLEGTWQVEVSTRRSAFDEPLMVLDVPVH